MAWWCASRDAGRLIHATKDGDIPKAAAALGIVVTEHAEVVARATAAVAKIETRATDRRALSLQSGISSPSA
jgi:hypothetical protein